MTAGPHPPVSRDNTGARRRRMEPPTCGPRATVSRAEHSRWAGQWPEEMGWWAEVDWAQDALVHSLFLFFIFYLLISDLNSFLNLKIENLNSILCWGFHTVIEHIKRNTNMKEYIQSCIFFLCIFFSLSILFSFSYFSFSLEYQI